MSLRSLLAMTAGLALVGFVLRPDSRPASEVDPQLFRANFERWQTLPEPERDALRERWQRLTALPPGDQEALQQRADTLRRLRGNLAQRQGHEPTLEEAAAELARIVGVTRKSVQRPDTAELSDAELLAQLEARTRRCLSQFLDNLEKHGRVTQQQLVRLRAQALPEQLRDALLLLKSEQINLYAEVGVHPDEADELMRLPPLDVAARTEHARHQRGFLGRLGTALPLSDDDRRSLAADDGVPEFKERLRDLKSQQLRELLSAHGVASDRIDELLAGPVNELEREADDVLAAEMSR